MSTSPERRKVYVGLFVTVALAILGGGILAVGNIRDTFSRKITVTAVFEQVNGLQAGDNVWCSGLKVGVVRSLRFIDTERVEVSLALGEEVAKFIHQDAKASIGSDGLIGNAIVVVSGGSAEAPALSDGDRLAVEKKTALSDVLEMLQDNNENLLAITTDVKAITSRLSAGEGTAGKLLTDEELFTDVKGAVGTLQRAAEHAERLTASLSSFSGKLNTPGHLVHDLATDDTLLPQVADTVADLRAAVGKASETLDEIAAGAADPSTPVGALLTDEPTAADLKATLSSLREASALLAVDLEALQHNFLLRPYFKKKEREEKKAAKAAARGE